MQALEMREGFDVGLEMSGAEKAFRQMLLVMIHGGKIAMLGIPPGDMAIDWNKVIFKEPDHQRHLRPGDVRHLVQGGSP